jgi:Cu-Zn family superoxide dismutase
MVRRLFPVLGVLVVAAACDRSPEPEINRVAEVTGEVVADQVVHVQLTSASGQTAAGMLSFSDTSGGLKVTGRISGLPVDRELGFHIHEVGDCSAPDASSAGDHFNPGLQPHGDPDGDAHHAGDMPNLDVDDEGVAEVDVTLEGLRLDSSPANLNVRNRAVVVHAQADDYKTQPAGASGDRIACGVIGAEARP